MKSISKKIYQYSFFYLIYRKSMDWFLYDNGLRHERVKSL